MVEFAELSTKLDAAIAKAEISGQKADLVVQHVVALTQQIEELKAELDTRDDVPADIVSKVETLDAKSDELTAKLDAVDGEDAPTEEPAPTE